MKITKISKISLTIAALSLGALSQACKKPASSGSAGGSGVTEKTILIGEVSSLTGSESTFGVSTHQGIELAIKEINAAGGVKGRTFELKTLDDLSKPEEAATAATKLINQVGVFALLGEVASSRSLAMAPIAQNAKTPMITPSSTNPKVTLQGDYIFRTCFIDPFQGTVMAKFAAEHLKVKKVAVLRDVKNDYSVGLADFFTKTFTAGGGEILVDQSYSSGDNDFKSQLTAIRAKKPEAIYVPGYYTEVGLIARQAKELGLNVPLMGGDGWDSPKLAEIGGQAVQGHYFSNHYSAEDASPAVQNFIKKYKEAYGATPDGLGALGYDAMKLLANAIERAPNLTKEDVRKALAETKGFQAVTGNLTLDANRNPTKSAVVLKVEGSGYKYVATVNP